MLSPGALHLFSKLIMTKCVIHNVRDIKSSKLHLTMFISMVKKLSQRYNTFAPFKFYHCSCYLHCIYFIPVPTWWSSVLYVN